MIELKHVEKAFHDSKPLKDINAVINTGDVIAVIGPSGAGKSTLLRCINMLGEPTNGQIIVDGEDVTAKGYDVNKARKKIGMVFQSFNLFSHLTIIENIMNPQIQILGRDKKQAYEKAMSLLHKVGLGSKYAKYPDELSGGQKQRVAICRTLAMDPEVILFDEPTSALDPTMVGEVESVIRDLAKEGRTMVIVTHEMKFARTISNRVFYMDEGIIYEEGSPEQIFENPQKEKTIIFINQLKSLEFLIDSSEFDFQATAYRIEEYGRKNLLEHKLIYQIESAFEELCGQILMSHLGNFIRAKVSIIYSQKENVTKMIVLYNGSSFDPNDSDKGIALKILKNSISEISHYDIVEGEYTNKVEIIF